MPALTCGKIARYPKKLHKLTGNHGNWQAKHWRMKSYRRPLDGIVKLLKQKLFIFVHIFS